MCELRSRLEITFGAKTAASAWVFYVVGRDAVEAHPDPMGELVVHLARTGVATILVDNRGAAAGVDCVARRLRGALGSKADFLHEVSASPPPCCSGTGPSSTASGPSSSGVRDLLRAGDAEGAAAMLGLPRVVRYISRYSLWAPAS